MASAVTDSTIFSGVWQNIFALIDAIADPESRTGSPKWKFAGFPTDKVDDSTAYPVITIDNPTPSGMDLHNLGQNISTITVNIVIDIFSLKASQLDSLSDSVIDAIETGRGTLFTNKITNIRLVGGSYQAIERSAIKVHNKQLTYEVEYDLT